MNDWEKLQKFSLDRRKEESEIAKNLVEKSEAGLRLRLAQMGLKEKADQMTAENLFRQFYDVTNNTLNPNTMSMLQEGQPDPITHKGKMTKAQAAQYRDLLQMGITGLYESNIKDFTDHYKPTKDAYGNYVSDDPQTAPIMSLMNGLKAAQNTLYGRTTNAPANANTPQAQLSGLAQKHVGSLQGQNAAVYGKLITSFPDANTAIGTLSNLTGISPEDKLAIADSVTDYFKEASPLIQQQQQQQQQVQDKLGQMVHQNERVVINAPGAMPR